MALEATDWQRNVWQENSVETDPNCLACILLDTIASSFDHLLPHCSLTLRSWHMVVDEDSRCVALIVAHERLR